jgi:hypothetical protein
MIVCLQTIRSKRLFPRKNLLVVMIFLLASKEYVTEKKEDCSQQSNKTNRSCRLVLVIALSALRFPFYFPSFGFFFLRVTFVLRASEFLNQMKSPKHLNRKFSCRRETEPYKLTWAIWVAVAALFFPSLGGFSLFLFQS